MKSKIILTGSTITLLAPVVWAAIALSAEPPATGKDQLAKNAALLVRMDAKKADILKRAGMAAPLELPEAGEEDFVAQAQAEGRIIEVTLDQVEAALKAAAATTSTIDDAAAMKLAHWGSYRFFLDEKSPAKNPKSSR